MSKLEFYWSYLTTGSDGAYCALRQSSFEKVKIETKHKTVTIPELLELNGAAIG